MAFPRPKIDLGPLHATVSETLMYYVIYVLFVVAVVAFWLIVRSPLRAGRSSRSSRTSCASGTSGSTPTASSSSGSSSRHVRGTRRCPLRAACLRFAFPLLMDWHESGKLHSHDAARRGRHDSVRWSGDPIFVIGKDIILDDHPAWEIVLGAFFIACVLGIRPRESSARSPTRSPSGANGEATGRSATLGVPARERRNPRGHRRLQELPAASRPSTTVGISVNADRSTRWIGRTARGRRSSSTTLSGFYLPRHRDGAF